MGAGSDMTRRLPTSSDGDETRLSTRLRRSAVVGIAEDARVALLSRLIDHAPLFPPASLPLPAALEEDRRALESAAAFALGRFVCPASRLAELPDVGRGVSVVLDRPVELEQRVEALEARWPVDLGGIAGRGREVYVEVPLDGELEARLDALWGAGVRAKVRCGGPTVPTLASLAAFVRGCAARRLVFKATAGLHRAVRQDGEHGFLNLLAATVFGNEDEALAETDEDAFQLDRESFRWRGLSAGHVEIVRARRERLASIGSCSFFEPVEELERLGALTP